MSGDPGTFPNTRWTLVLSAGQDEGPEASVALETLCQDYWYPLYCYVRRRGYSAEDSEDLTQSFFQRLLERRDLAMADAEKGRFRSFLLASLKHFMADQWDRTQAKKRGGDRVIISFDQLAAEERFQSDRTPDKLFAQNWAQTLLTHILEKLAMEQREAGKEKLFEETRPFVAWSTAVDSDYSKAAKALDMNENAVRVQVFRLRKRYTEILRQEIAQTVASKDDVAREMDYLFNVLRGDAA